MNPIGIYYAFWEDSWQADYTRYIRKAADLGLDVLEIACTPVPDMSENEMIRLRELAADYGILLTAGHGQRATGMLSCPSGWLSWVSERLEAAYTAIGRSITPVRLTNRGTGPVVLLPSGRLAA